MTIDLSQLPPPGIIESLDYEQIRAELLADFTSRYPEYSALLESDPAVKLIEVTAYRDMLMRQRVNDAGRANLLAFAGGTDLDHLAAFYGVVRLVVQRADPAPPGRRSPRCWKATRRCGCASSSVSRDGPMPAAQVITATGR